MSEEHKDKFAQLYSEHVNRMNVEQLKAGQKDQRIAALEAGLKQAALRLNSIRHPRRAAKRRADGGCVVSRKREATRYAEYENGILLMVHYESLFPTAVTLCGISDFANIHDDGNSKIRDCQETNLPVSCNSCLHVLKTIQEIRFT